MSSTSQVIYYVALPFVSTDEGLIVPGEGIECAHAQAAMTRARMLAAICAGAVAFSRTGDPALGEFEPAEVLASFGQVPEDLSTL
jgi:hypothetical protein